MKNILFAVLFVVPFTVLSQDTAGTSKYSDSLLRDVTVTAFLSHLHWKAVPAAVATLTSKDFTRYGGTSAVPVLNMVPGVRMEERSPASYRLSLRGSLLRSPFGVRNVKLYWNDIPLTDGGGNTYLNLVDMGQLTGAEVLKGPVASMYGAGTGGAVLLHSDLLFSDKKTNLFSAGITGGSFGLFNQQAGWNYSDKKMASSVRQTHLQTDGYRQQSAMRKDVVTWQAATVSGKQQFRFLVFYTDLLYQTPGGITQAQFQSDPTLARQPAGALPGSVQQKAAIYNKTFFAAVHHTSQLGKYFSLRSFLMANETKFANPFITNYEKRMEDNLGAGTNLVFRTASTHLQFQWINGVEWLYNRSAISNYGNRSGVADTLQFSDRVYARQLFGFSQAQLSLGNTWNFTAGLSVNGQTYRYQRFGSTPTGYTRKKIAAVVTPRLAVLYRLTPGISVYAIAAKGFSAPAIAEIRPSDGNYYGDLNAEYGWNYEAGIKGIALDGRLEFDMAFYYFRLENAIVRRNNTAGAEYFVNAGGTVQKGWEGLIRYQLLRSRSGFIASVKAWSSYSYQPYRFSQYQQAGTEYSGNALTGVPRNIWVSGIDMDTREGIYLQASVNCVSSIPLTDANDAFADAYQLVQVQCGYKPSKRLDIFIGADNLLNQRYSLGNDINAAGKRYYNPAAGRNGFAGVRYIL